MRAERIAQELALVRARYGDVDHDPELTWFVIRKFPMPPGWSTDVTRLLILLPAGYPTTPPDNFYTHIDLRLANGGVAGNSSDANPLPDEPCLMFSFHVEDEHQWQANDDLTRGHTLLDYLDGVEARLQEAS